MFRKEQKERKRGVEEGTVVKEARCRGRSRKKGGMVLRKELKGWRQGFEEGTEGKEARRRGKNNRREVNSWREECWKEMIII